jgi:vacuolar iron transporter family protein
MTKIVSVQQHEINNFYLYQKLASKEKKQNNKNILLKLAEMEEDHYHYWRDRTGKELKPNQLKINWYYWLAKYFGLIFILNLMIKKQQKQEQINYIQPKSHNDDGLDVIVSEEMNDEFNLINQLHEEKINYIGSIVLGLNDALVELTGALAGFAFAFTESRIVALAGLITGIAAALSMASSEYLSKKHENDHNNALKPAIYTGLTYIVVVIFLVLPFLLLPNPFISLGITLLIAVLIIIIFNYYVAVVTHGNFRKSFTEMIIISLGVTFLSFVIGLLVRLFLNIEI